MQRSQFRLLAERRFGPFFGVQLLGAFNGHLFRQALVVVLAYQTASFTRMGADTVQNVAQALFVLPFLLFSATAGQLADRHDKARLITAAVAVELGAMALGAAGFLLESMPLLFTALLAAGAQAALFAPVKYSILPHHLGQTELMGGNGLVLTGTAVAMVAGTMAGGTLGAHPQWGTAAVALSSVAISVAGIALSRAIPAAPAPDPGLRINWNLLSETRRSLSLARQDRTVFVSILGMSWFWFYAFMLVTQLPNLAKNVLAGSEHAAATLLVAAAAGIAIGSLVCERLSGYKVEIGLIPFGAIGLTLFGIDLWWASATHAVQPAAGIAHAVGALGHSRVLADLLLIGIFGGLYGAPLCALIQQRSEPSCRSRIIAANNVVNAVFMIGAALVALALLGGAGLTIPQLILATALLNAAVAVYICARVPEFLARFMVWMLIHSVYRLKANGLERIPDSGPAVIVSNHVSYADALVISAACRRPIRWVVDRDIFRIPLLSFFFRTVKAIPIAPARIDPKMLQNAYDAIASELAAGQLVGLFPEGERTSNGEMNEFKGGIRKILDRTPVPVVPLALCGLWQSIFARNSDKLRHAMKLFPRIGIAVGEPIDAAVVTPEGLYRAIGSLRGNWK